jgi:hypothetical protein
MWNTRQTPCFYRLNRFEAIDFQHLRQPRLPNRLNPPDPPNLQTQKTAAISAAETPVVSKSAEHYIADKTGAGIAQVQSDRSTREGLCCGIVTRDGFHDICHHR